MFNRNFNPITGNRLFIGETDQEKGAKEYYGAVKGAKTNVENRFDNYKNPFEFGDVEGKLDDVYGGYEDIINRDTAEAVAKEQTGAAQSLASRGITGGSALTDTQTTIASKVNKGKSNALSNLGIGKASSMADLMKYFNQMKFATEQAGTGVDFGNIDNIFKKLGLQGGAVGMLDNTTWLDDVWEGMKGAGELAEGIGSLATGFG